MRSYLLMSLPDASVSCVVEYWNTEGTLERMKTYHNLTQATAQRIVDIMYQKELTNEHPRPTEQGDKRDKSGVPVIWN